MQLRPRGFGSGRRFFLSFHQCPLLIGDAAVACASGSCHHCGARAATTSRSPTGPAPGRVCQHRPCSRMWACSSGWTGAGPRRRRCPCTAARAPKGFFMTLPEGIGAPPMAAARRRPARSAMIRAPSCFGSWRWTGRARGRRVAARPLHGSSTSIGRMAGGRASHRSSASGWSTSIPSSLIRSAVSSASHGQSMASSTHRTDVLGSPPPTARRFCEHRVLTGILGTRAAASLDRCGATSTARPTAAANRSGWRAMPGARRGGRAAGLARVSAADTAAMAFTGSGERRSC